MLCYRRRMWIRVLWTSCVLFASSCGEGTPALDAGSDGGGADAGRADSGATIDAGVRDAGSVDAGSVDAGVDDAGSFDAGAEPTSILRPLPGELTIIQMRLPGLVQLGEAAVLVGPDGTMVLMDVGNSSHDDEVRGLVRALNTSWVTPANGFPRARGPLEVDWIVLSHFHSDHIGGFRDLCTGPDAVQVTRGVVHRGYVDVGAGLTESDYRDLCDQLRGPMMALDVPLCTASPAAPCNPADFAGPHPATACAGLFLGDLDDALDDGLAEPSFLDLGDGARMVFVAADAFVSDGSTPTQRTAFGHSDSNEENARSLVTIIEHGPFRYHWGGDLTGAGAVGEPDVESHLIGVAGARFYGPLGADVVHAHHHVRATSSNATFVDATAPRDGRSRNVIGGINGGHIGSPHAEVLARFGDDGRLGEGRIWITMSATGGATHPALVDADADVILQTIGSGAGYRVQAARSTPESRSYRAVR